MGCRRFSRHADQFSRLQQVSYAEAVAAKEFSGPFPLAGALEARVAEFSSGKRCFGAGKPFSSRVENWHIY